MDFHKIYVRGRPLTDYHGNDKLLLQIVCNVAENKLLTICSCFHTVHFIIGVSGTV